MVGEGGLLGGRYRIGDRIAGGGMGTVFRATDERLSRDVAVKLLNEDLAQDARFVERFRREARAAAALSHPGVAAVFDFGEDSGTPFIVMEIVRGRDLARVLREDGPLPPRRAAAVGAQICDALAHAHAAGLIHRDVKPANVIVDENDTVKVTDFGIARAGGESSLTMTGSVLGSAQYMAPEQASGAEATPAADVYSAGIVLYEMLTGAVPFTGDSALAVAMRHVSDEVPLPSSINPAVPTSLDRIVTRATAKNSSARWHTAREMSAALREETGLVSHTRVMGVGDAATTTVWPIPGSTYDPGRLGRRVIAGALLLAAVAGALFLWRISTRPEEAPAAGRRDRDRGAGATEPSEEASQPAPVTFELPDLTGAELKEAEKVLEAQGLVVESQEVPGPEPKDVVLGSEPPGGTAMSAGDTVTLIVSDGTDSGEEDDEEESGEEKPGNSEEAPGKDKDKHKDKDGD